ncbi:MAG: nhaA [Gemmataceae bacterium]|nr:nhaA [Gemmataceae bacterium]
MAHPPSPASRPAFARLLPDPPVRRLVRPLARFLRIESASGAVLLACTVVALVLANSPAAGWYHAFWHTPLRLQVGPFALAGDLGHLAVNDVLMTVFFFVVGLEIKRELVAGELQEPRKAVLPVVAAVGGMLAPAAVYLALIAGKPGGRGWGIPMATDIAFVVGVLTLLGRRVPLGLKILLLSLAIADDIGAVLVIAVFYSTGLHPFMLLLALGGLCLAAILTELGVRSTRVYVLVGVGVWLAVYQSGVHPTVAGVLLGLLTPSGTWVSRAALRLALTDVAAGLRDDGADEVGAEDLRLLSFAARESVSPLDRLETQLHPWVGFVVMPLFALANAGVEVTPAALTDPVAVAVALGLFLGKPVGIVLTSWLAVRLGLAELPRGVTWGMMVGGGALAGIGFTMSLFVAGLALDPEHLAAGKVGTLTGSVCGAAVGVVILAVALRRAPRE